MQKARIPYEADGEHLVKGQRTFDISNGLVEKIDSIEERAQKNKIDAIVVNGEVVQPNEKKEVELTIPRVEDSDTSRSRTDALSARVGKELSDEIKNLKSLGRFLSVWNATTGLPETNPLGSPYYFRTGDYYMIGAIGSTNYKPSGDHYVEGVASTEVETAEIKTSDVYMYDGSSWVLQINSERVIAIDDKLSTTSENPVQNKVITEEINKKVNVDDLADVATSGDYNDLINKLTAGTGIKIENNQIINTNTNAEWGKISGTLSDQTDLQTALNSKINKTDMSTTLSSVDDATVPTTKAVKSYVDGSHPHFVLVEGTDYTVEYDATKGTSPFSSSYGYTNVTITKKGVEWIEGALYFFAVDASPATSTYRNVRVRIGTEGERIGLGSPSSVSAAYSFFTKAYAGTFIYNKKYYATGALHSAFYDSNTTYAYLVNSFAAGNVVIDGAGYGARYSLIFPTTPIGSTAPRYSSLVKSSATGATKACPTIKFYADRHTQYVYTANIAAGAASANATYQNYTTHDLRYTHNYASANFSANQRIFLWLEKFNPDDYSFETSNTTNHMMTEDKISTVFPDTTEGDIYLWYLGQNTSTLYTCQPDFEALYRIYKYTPSTGEMKPFSPITGLESKQDVITDLDTIRAGAKLGETALQSYTETDPVFSSSVASGITNTDITNWNNKQSAISDLATIRSGAALGATALQSYTETDPVFTSSPAGGITENDIKGWNNKQSTIDDLATIRAGAALGATALQSYTETDPVFTASPAGGITSTDINNWNSKQSNISDLATIRAGAKLGETALQSYIETDPVFTASPAGGITSDDISNWNNKGSYSKPSGGIPKTDLSSTVQTSLGKADSAIQEETDPVFNASPAKNITSENITSWTNKQNVINDLETIRSGAALGATAVQPSGVGNGKVTIKQGGTELGSFTLNQSGDKEINISAGLTDVSWGDIKGTIASQTDLKTILDSKLESGDISKVGKSNKYDDLDDKPTIGQGVLTVKRNGTSIATFSANQVGDITADITIPTNTNQLTNGAGFITLSSVPSKLSQLTNDANYVKTTDLADVATSGAFADLTGTEGVQTTSNLVTDLVDADNTHYPSAKAVADAMQSAGYGDMLKSVYDPTGKNADAFNYNNMYNKPVIDTVLDVNSTNAVTNKAIAEKINQIELSKSPNVSIIGEPTIVQGNISGFSSSNYLIAPFLSSFAGYPFTLHMDIYTGTDVSAQQNIIDANFGMAFAIKNGKFVIALSTNGTNWDLGEHTGTHTVLPETSYCVEIEWNRTNYVLRYSTDRTNYTTDITVAGTKHLSGNTLYIGGHGAVDHPFKGTLNFNERWFKSGEQLVWQGMDDAGLATRANLSLSNLNVQGEARFANKQDKLTAGKNISIDNNVISSNVPYVGGTDLTGGLTAKANVSSFSSLSDNQYGSNSTYQATPINTGGTHWSSSGSSGMKIYFKFDKPTEVSSITLNFNSTSTYGIPTFSIQGGNSATSLTTIASGLKPKGDGLNAYTFDKVSYQYFMVDIVNSNWINCINAYIGNVGDGILSMADYNEFKNKQNAISDLSTIRSGASKGATAMQPASGGSVGQVLTKTSSGYEWADGVSRAGEVKTQSEYNSLTPKSGVIYFIKN